MSYVGGSFRYISKNLQVGFSIDYEGGSHDLIGCEVDHLILSHGAAAGCWSDNPPHPLKRASSNWTRRLYLESENISSHKF